jgi:hypothetical protein
MNVSVSVGYFDLAGEPRYEIYSLSRSTGGPDGSPTPSPVIISVPTDVSVATNVADAQQVPPAERTPLLDQIDDPSPPVDRNLVGVILVVGVLTITVFLLRRRNTKRGK